MARISIEKKLPSGQIQPEGIITFYARGISSRSGMLSGEDISKHHSTDLSDSAILTFSSLPRMKRLVSRAKTTVITKLRA